MYEVIVSYENGENIKFHAEEFNIDVDGVKTSVPQKFMYKDYKGNDAPIYLTLKQIAGIVVTPYS